MDNENTKSYDVVEYTVGSTKQDERITFSTVDEMEKAYQDVNDGADFNVKIKNESGEARILKVSHKMVRQKLYEGRIQFGAVPSKGEK